MCCFDGKTGGTGAPVMYGAEEKLKKIVRRKMGAFECLVGTCGRRIDDGRVYQQLFTLKATTQRCLPI